MEKDKKRKKAPAKKRTQEYEKPFTVAVSFEDFIKIAVTPKEQLKEEDFKPKQ